MYTDYNFIEVNEKINYNPLVLIFTLFYSTNIKTNIECHYKNCNDFIVKDNINIKIFPAINTDCFKFSKNLLLRKEYNVFYKNHYNEGITENREGNKTILKNRIAWIEKNKPKKDYINLLVNKHNRVMIYNTNEGYLIEIYK